MTKIKPNLMYIGLIVCIVLLTLWTKNWFAGFLMLFFILLFGWLIRSSKQTIKMLNQKPVRQKTLWQK
jgi:chromate transport protein ChrA